MSQTVYGLLKSKVETDNGEYTSKRTHLTHYNLITVENEHPYQVNIDIQSDKNKPNVKMLRVEKYQNDILQTLDSLDSGFFPLDEKNKELALDYLREELFDRQKLFDSDPMPADDIATVLDNYLESHEHIVVFGTRYGKGYQQQDHYGTLRSIQGNAPSTGVDNVHLNQGSIGTHAIHNGIYKDGALFVKRADGSYTAFFFAFSEQCQRTDDDGNCL